MADLKRWPMALNQPGYEYPAELFRAEHHDATSGGNGVGAPTALKVTAQAAADGTVSILPGGATIKSTYAGADGQSYHARNFQPFTLEVPPTGSASGGRHDLVILRVCDPQYDTHPDHGGGEISAEEAANYDFWWFELLQNRAASTAFDFPHVKLAQIRRGPNQTIVTSDDIVDLRELANPKNYLHMRANNLNMADAQSLHTGSKVWPEQATHTMHIPEWATHVQMHAAWGTVHAHQTTENTAASGQVRVALVLPGEGTISSQQSTWRTVEGSNRERFNIVLGDNRPVPAAFRGRDVQVELRGTKTWGANIYMDGDSTWTVQLYFEQDVL